MKVFLDVGGHEGETLLAVMDPKYGFDKIFCFEPVKKLHQKLKKIVAGKSNIILCEYGLWDKNTDQKIYSPGTLSGSLFEKHHDVDAADFETCMFIEASYWFKEIISFNDQVFVKLNCEGAEADILLNLISSKEIFKIYNVMIDFDVRKVAGMESLQFTVFEKFKEVGFESFSLCEHVMKGPTHLKRIQNWLDNAGARKTDVISKSRQAIYWLIMSASNRRPGSYWEVKHFIKRYIPSSLLNLIGARKA